MLEGNTQFIQLFGLHLRLPWWRSRRIVGTRPERTRAAAGRWRKIAAGGMNHSHIWNHYLTGALRGEMLPSVLRNWMVIGSKSYTLYYSGSWIRNPDNPNVMVSRPTVLDNEPGVGRRSRHRE